MAAPGDVETLALRGPALSFIGDPFRMPGLDAVRHESDALVLIRGGRIAAFGDFKQCRHLVPESATLVHYPDSLILPGFIDCHVHYPQTQMIAAHGEQLVDWLQRHTFPAEQQFEDPDHGRQVARIFLRECLRAGTTTAMVFGTVHPQSVQVFFEESERLGTRMIAGKVLMDRNAPAALLDTPQGGYDQSKALMRQWHGRGRQLYAVTPRFAPTSSEAQMELAGALWREHPGSYLQSHVSENIDEVAWAKSLFPERQGYLDIYDHYGQLGPRAVFGHGVHLDERELARFHESGAAIAHCPTSNLFLGSGCLDLASLQQAHRPVRVGLGTDLGAGTSFSQLRTLGEAYKVAQLRGQSLDPWQLLYLATRGAAQALYLEDRVGSIAAGMEADLVVLDLRSTPLIDFRMRHCRSLEEALFVQMMLADDRATRATYVAGQLCYERPDGPAARA